MASAAATARISSARFERQRRGLTAMAGVCLSLSGNPMMLRLAAARVSGAGCARRFVSAHIPRMPAA
jgi:hypothetical protein